MRKMLPLFLLALLLLNGCGNPIPAGYKPVKIAFENIDNPTWTMIGSYPASVTYINFDAAKSSGIIGFFASPDRQSWWFGYSGDMAGTSGRVALEFAGSKGGYITAVSPLIMLPLALEFVKLPISETPKGDLALSGFSYYTGSAWTAANPVIGLTFSPPGEGATMLTLNNIPLEWQLHSLSWDSPSGSVRSGLNQIYNPDSNQAAGFIMQGTLGIGFNYPPTWVGRKGRVIAIFKDSGGTAHKVVGGTVTLQ